MTRLILFFFTFYKIFFLSFLKKYFVREILNFLRGKTIFLLYITKKMKKLVGVIASMLLNVDQLVSITRKQTETSCLSKLVTDFK